MTTSVISLEHAVISNNELRIIGASTSFAGEKRIDIPSVKALQDKLKSVIQLARTHGAKIKGQKAMKSELSSLDSTVSDLTVKYHALFDSAVDFWKGKVDLSSKTIPNYNIDALNDGYEIRNKMMELFHHDQPLSKILEVNRRLSDIENSIMRSKNPSDITFTLQV
ncbi:hypothetical protein C4G84_RS13960 [Vibrio parahaemolyticus O5:K30]|nr:hypothetical protein [Vibrio parahaemolyticus O5:K30]